MNKRLVIILAIVAVIIILVVLYRKGKLGFMRPKRLLKYFELKEFDTPAVASEMGNVPTYVEGGKTYVRYSGEKNMDRDFLFKLDKAREIIEKGWNALNPSKKIVFNINSGYRSPAYNDTLSGSVPNSAHTYGKAVDIAWGSYDTAQKEAILGALWEAGFRRFGTANSFVHTDNADADTGHPTPASWGYPTKLYEIAEIEALAEM